MIVQICSNFGLIRVNLFELCPNFNYAGGKRPIALLLSASCLILIFHDWLRITIQYMSKNAA